jgi:chromosome segregation ATPase
MGSHNLLLFKTREIGMANIHQVAEQQIRQYESQLKHIDDVMERASKIRTENTELKAELGAELKELAEHRGELADYIEELRDRAPFEWMEEGGPMVLWDAVAERIEELVERIEH